MLKAPRHLKKGYLSYQDIAWIPDVELVVEVGDSHDHGGQSPAQALWDIERIKQ